MLFYLLGRLLGLIDASVVFKESRFLCIQLSSSILFQILVAPKP